MHIDPLGGLAGDMFLAAALASGLVEKDDLEAALRTLGVGPVNIVAEQVKRGAFTGTHIHFEGWREEEEGTHRTLSAIIEMLEASGLPDPVCERAVSMFSVLGEVEAGVHGVPLETVHFHECGALDSIFDFVCAAWIVEEADVTWSVAPISIGRGSRTTDHGTVPLPVPATARLLQGADVVPRDVEAELVTPTGATILHTLQHAGRLVARPAGRVQSVACGAGTRDLAALPNLVRFFVIDPSPGASADGTADRVGRLTCEIDDMNPELVAHAEERLFQAGALDVVREPVLMKKGRQGVRLSVLCRPGDRDRMAELLFRETTTFGLRLDTVERVKLARRRVEVRTRFGAVRVKVGYWEGKPLKAAPEYEDCAQRAAEAAVPLRAVYEAAQQEALSVIGDEG